MEEILKVSVNYFTYKKSIKFDVKYNSNENFPLFVSIVNYLNSFEYHDKFKYRYNSPFKDFIVKSIIKMDETFIIKCAQLYKIKTKDFLIENITKIFDNYYNYSLKLSNQFISLDSISTKHSYYFKFADNYIVHFNTINMSDNIWNYNNNSLHEFFTLWIKLPSSLYSWQGTELILNIYNTLNSYQFNHTMNMYSHDNTIKVSKIIHQNLKPPYGDCSDYNEDRPFNGTNQWHCYRQCMFKMAVNKFNCKPVLIGGTLHELDFISDDYIECNSSIQKLCDKYFLEKKLDIICINKCPKDCLNMDFKMKSVRKKEMIFDKKINNKRHVRLSLVWDTNHPLLVYNEELVMSFIDYICNCGGYVGLLFGASAVDILFLLFSKSLWLNIWRIFLEILQKLIHNFVIIRRNINNRLNAFGGYLMNN